LIYKSVAGIYHIIIEKLNHQGFIYTDTKAKTSDSHTRCMCRTSSVS